MAMASPPRRPASTTPPFTPLRSPVHRARVSIEEKVARQLATLPGPDDVEERDFEASTQEQAGAAELWADSPPRKEDEGGTSNCGGDDAMLQYLGSMGGACSGGEESDAGSEDSSFEIGTLGSAAPHATDEPPAAIHEPVSPPEVAKPADATAPLAESHPTRSVAPRLSSVSSAVPALFSGCDPARMRQQISLLTRQVQRGEDTTAALQSRLTQTKEDRDRSELSNVDLRVRADAVRQHVCLLKAQVQELSGVQAPTLEELRGEMLNQAQNDAGVLAQKLAEQQQLVRQLYAQLEDQALADSSERESLASEVERLLRSAAFGDTICSQHNRRTESMQKELMEQQKQTESLQSRLDAEQLRTEAAEGEASRMAAQVERLDKEVAELQTELKSSRVSQSETEDKLSGARALIQDLESQLADLRAFSGRGRGGDLRAVADLEQEVSLRKAAEAECERLRQELDRAASLGRTNTACTDGNANGHHQSSGDIEHATGAAIAPQLERPQLQRQPTESHAQAQGLVAENAVSEELQALRADMQLLLQQRRPQHDEDGTEKQRVPQDSTTGETMPASQDQQRSQEAQPQTSDKYVPSQTRSVCQWRTVPLDPASDSNSSDDFSGEDNCGNAMQVAEPTIAHRQLPGAPQQSRHGDPATDAAATRRNVQSRQEVEQILNALEAARRSLDLSTSDGPGGWQSAHAMSSASRPEFVSRSALSVTGAAAAARRSFGQLYADEEMQMARWWPMEGAKESTRLSPGRSRLMNVAGHNNRYSMD